MEGGFMEMFELPAAEVRKRKGDNTRGCGHV
jgi:hypothetical protein